MSVTFEDVVVASEDGEGRLVFDGGRLVAVLVRLSSLHGDQQGAWYLEAGLGAFATPSPPTFPDLEAAKRWFKPAAA